MSLLASPTLTQSLSLTCSDRAPWPRPGFRPLCVSLLVFQDPWCAGSLSERPLCMCSLLVCFLHLKMFSLE